MNHTNDNIARCRVYTLARHDNRDLRCVLLSSTLCSRSWVQVQNTSRIQNTTANPIMID